MSRMDCAAQSFASVPEAAMLRARVPVGSLSHLSGKRFAAPARRQPRGPDVKNGVLTMYDDLRSLHTPVGQC